MLAAVKACGAGAVLSHRSAGELWEFLDPEDRKPEVTVLGPGTRLPPGIVVHRTSQLAARDRTRHEGIPVTTPARTLIDLAAALTEAELRHAVRRAQGLRRVNTRQLLEVIGRLGPRRGTGRLRQSIATGPAPTRSALEDAVLDLLLAGGFEHPDVNRPLVIEGRRVIPDFRWPEQRLVIEADGAAWHDNALARHEDIERQALLEASGERVIRVSWHQAVTRSAETVDRIRAAGAPAAPARRGRGRTP
jgi:very-short-patch-repair endonuclease